MTQMNRRTMIVCNVPYGQHIMYATEMAMPTTTISLYVPKLYSVPNVHLL